MPTDIQRTLVVVSPTPDLWAALRDRLLPELVHVRSASPNQMEYVFSSLKPWPWLVASDCTALDIAALKLLNETPVALRWHGPVPHSLRPAQISDWRQTCSDVSDLLVNGQKGWRFTPVRGLLAPGGIRLHSPLLENLLASWPAPLPAHKVSGQQVHSLNNHLCLDLLPWRVQRQGGQLHLLEEKT